MKKKAFLFIITVLLCAPSLFDFCFIEVKAQVAVKDGFLQIGQIDNVASKDSTNAISTKTSTIELYQIALDEISEMLNGQKPLSFKRAVFLTENAYYDGKLDWKEFCGKIEQIKLKLNQMIVDKNLQQYKTAGNWAVFSYMIDSIPENNYHPYKYDFENFMGDKDYESFMVASLLTTKKGNCHSLPFLYKILADEINVEAFIATAPMHVYIKHKDEKDQWWNLELTSGTFSRSSFIMESFNVSDAGIESGLYMKALSVKESIALCLFDLLVNYDNKTGIYYGDFVRKAYTEGLKVYPNSLLVTLKVNDQKYQLDKAMERYGLKDYRKIKLFPELVKLDDELKETNTFISKIGYSSLTPEQYRDKVLQIKNKQTQATK